MNKMTKKIVGACSGVLVAAAVIFGVFLMLSNREQTTKADEKQILLEKDMENAYPETPTEVVKLYWRFNKYLYNKGASDEDTKKLFEQLRYLYDDELLKDESNSLDNMIKNFEKDKKDRGGDTIVSTVVEKYDNVKVEAGKNDQKYATVIVAVHTKKSGKSSTFYESFRCRTNKGGKWKILGWKMASQQEAVDADVS